MRSLVGAAAGGVYTRVSRSVHPPLFPVPEWLQLSLGCTSRMHSCMCAHSGCMHAKRAECHLVCVLATPNAALTSHIFDLHGATEQPSCDRTRTGQRGDRVRDDGNWVLARTCWSVQIGVMGCDWNCVETLLITDREQGDSVRS